MCPVKISPPGVVVRRAGATARLVKDDKTGALMNFVFKRISSPSYVDGGVLLCGGRSRTVLHGDCVRYSPQ